MYAVVLTCNAWYQSSVHFFLSSLFHLFYCFIFLVLPGHYFCQTSLYAFRIQKGSFLKNIIKSFAFISTFSSKKIRTFVFIPFIILLNKKRICFDPNAFLFKNPPIFYPDKPKALYQEIHPFHGLSGFEREDLKVQTDY